MTPTITARAWHGQIIIEAKETRTYLTFDQAIDLMESIDRQLAVAATHSENDE